MQRFDLIAIGGGTAGLVTAAGAAALGLKAALVEREALGGDCLWTGCVPSKALVAAARLAHRMRHAERLGLVGASPAHAFRSVIERMRAARDRVALHDDPERFRRLGVTVVFGTAALAGRGRVAVNGRNLESSRIVLATGAVPSVPAVPGLAEAGFLTHLTAFEQETLPRRVAVLGGGPVGLELAQVYARLGAEVTVLERLPRLLPREDAEAAGLVRQVLEAEGVVVRTGVTVEHVEASGDPARPGKRVRARTATGEIVSIVADELLVATGRRPNTDGLGLAELGALDSDGVLRVDRRLRTAVPGLWAAGDVTGGPQFTHVADYQAKLVLRNAIFPFSRRARYDRVPAVTFTDPEIAAVGLGEAEARARFDDVTVYRYDLADLDRAVVDDRTTGFVKVVTRRRGRIVGATIVASGAGELVMPFVLAMDRGLPLGRLARVVYPYPTMIEGVKRAADAYYRALVGGRGGGWLRRVTRWLT